MEFVGSDPGAVQYGNFINYYSFHSSESRIKCLPKNIFQFFSEQPVCLDIGCNSGDLTQDLFQFLRSSGDISANKCKLLGIDIDPVLIERANENNKFSSNIQYLCVDVTKQVDVLNKFLVQHNKTRFDVTFIFSVTMWIHLNEGDDGLENFLKEMARLSHMLVIEPQNWKSYKTAEKRLKRQNLVFPAFSQIKWRHSIVSDIENILEKCGFEKIYQTSNSWDRLIFIFKEKCS